MCGFTVIYLFIIIMSLSTMSYLYRHIIQNEVMYAHFLKIRGLLLTLTKSVPKLKIKQFVVVSQKNSEK